MKPKIIHTLRRSQSYRLDEFCIVEVYKDGSSMELPYVSLKQNIYAAIRDVFRLKRDHLFTVYYGIDSSSTYHATMNHEGGLQLGCNDFSLATTKILARWAGMSPTNCQRIFED